MYKLNKDNSVLAIIALTIVVSGCINGGGSSETQQDGVQAIDVTGMDITPNQIFAGDSVTASIEIHNRGNHEAELIAELEDVDEHRGSRILESYCPDLFRIQNFDIQSERYHETQESYTLQPGEAIGMNWNLEQFDEERVQFFTDSGCDIRFSAPFNYSVESFQQFQIMSDNNVEPSNIESRSSQGPMFLDINMIGSTSDQGEPYFLSEDLSTAGGIDARLQLENQIPEDADMQGTISSQPPEIELIDNGELDKECESPDNIYLYGDDSSMILCEISSTEDVPSGRSEIFEIRAESDYQYSAPLGSRNVEVSSRGN